MAVVEIRGGKVSYRAVDGDISEEEAAQIQQFLEKSQQRINTAADIGKKKE